MMINSSCIQVVVNKPLARDKGEALCISWCLGRNKCKNVKKEGEKEYCEFGGGVLAHRCAVVVQMQPFRLCGKPHRKRDCGDAVY